MLYRPLSQQMLLAAHSILMQGVHRRDKSPGKYRNKQNWIGDTTKIGEEELKKGNLVVLLRLKR